MRIDKVITDTKRKRFDLFLKQVLYGNVWRSHWRIGRRILEIKGLNYRYCTRSNLRFYVFLPNRCIVPGVTFLPILGDTGYRLRVALRNTSSGQFSHCALPWCNRRSILTSESYKYKDSITFLQYFRAIFLPKIDPSTVFSTFDRDQSAKICQHS